MLILSFLFFCQGLSNPPHQGLLSPLNLPSPVPIHVPSFFFFPPGKFSSCVPSSPGPLEVHIRNPNVVPLPPPPQLHLEMDLSPHMDIRLASSRLSRHLCLQIEACSTWSSFLVFSARIDSPPPTPTNRIETLFYGSLPQSLPNTRNEASCPVLYLPHAFPLFYYVLHTNGLDHTFPTFRPPSKGPFIFLPMAMRQVILCPLLFSLFKAVFADGRGIFHF